MVELHCLSSLRPLLLVLRPTLPLAPSVQLAMLATAALGLRAACTGGFGG